MKYYIILLLLVSGLANAQNRSRVERLSNKVDVFVTKEIKEINTITIVSDNDPIGVASHMNRELLKHGIKTLSESAVRQRLLDITKIVEDNTTTISVDGATKFLKSDVVLKVSYGANSLSSVSMSDLTIEIIDLSNEGQVIGSSYLKGNRIVKVAAPAVILATLKKIK